MIQIDIPMPKGCWSCPYFRFARCMAKSRTGRKIKNTRNLDDKKQKWCPLKEFGGDSDDNH